MGLGSIKARLRRLEQLAGESARDRGPTVVVLRSIGPKPVPMSWPELLNLAKGVHPARATGNRAALAAAIMDVSGQILDGQADAGSPHKDLITSAIDRAKDGEPLERVLRDALPELVQAIDGELATGLQHAPPATSGDDDSLWTTPPPSADPPTP